MYIYNIIVEHVYNIKDQRSFKYRVILLPRRVDNLFGTETPAQMVIPHETPARNHGLVRDKHILRTI